MTIIFISGTGTGVGKTVVTAALATLIRQQGREVLPLKPVQTGEPAGSGDIHTIARLTGIQGMEFTRYPDPLAPNLAARQSGRPQVTLSGIAEWILGLDTPDRVLLVEGAGGVAVRLADDLTLLDVAAELNAPLLLVTALGLGSLNTAELSVQASRAAGVEVAGLIGGSASTRPGLAEQLNHEELPRLCKTPLLGALPEGAGVLSPGAFRQAAQESITLPRQLSGPSDAPAG